MRQQVGAGPAFDGVNADRAADEALLGGVVAAVVAAGAHLRERFTPDARPGSLAEVVAAIHANDAASLRFLREPLERLRPGAAWAEDELESGALPSGEWWVTDAVEGNINHIHGMTEWSVTATLVRDNRPVLTAVHLPLTGDTYTAVRGGGAFLNGVRLRASAKAGLDAALVGTGQARPGESADTFRRIGLSVAAMLSSALVTRVSVPATMQLIQVAAGRMDVFWQFSDVRSGLLAGALLVAEAGGTVTDAAGAPWSLSSPDFLAAAPALHAAAVEVLAPIR
ncbi:3'(2'),5'-bisphosphate nucleotidase CysQ [Streptacidiphilus sp. PB12-B1b]|uniref:inositol monophosphatase family protein n=1 Tax=Streptacidiphilus sp. PB12-B1b TaxID=2705012 RepID=UPI0015F98797|nr:inositol monophosphatase family protein [Streptacidiphilus sp. PB12-B1b]QMU79780.1 3'(2'),5'-bisphosphate nucleotidase CysQ [Streptacidiphilus sp. PB12-B1b]